jgi:signal transduction histidine kinase
MPTRMPDQEEAALSPDVGTLHFAVDAGLLFQLGEELVRKRSVALAELIKNAYDADATTVVVRFRDVRAAGGSIVITDNGNGMTFASVQAHWMRIATVRKAAEQISNRYQRVRTGAKGIGRFAARRLASRLVLKSVAKKYIAGRPPGREETLVEFNWEDFRSGAEVQSVPARYSRRDLPAATGKNGTGTELQLMSVRDVWEAEDFHALAQDLARLVAPVVRVRGQANGHLLHSSSQNKDPGIQIRIESPEFPEVSGDIRDQPPVGALAVLDGRLDSNGTAHYSIAFRNPKKSVHFTPKTRFPGVGPVQFQLHFFVYKRDYFAGLAINVADAAKRGREAGGVHLYVDRFRVAPYGDPGDDWLKLDEDRGRRLVRAPEDLARLAAGSQRPMLLLPGNNQLFGRVHLSRRTNPDIRQTLNREGVLETPSFQQLRSFVRKGIDYLTVAYARESESRRKKPDREKREDALTLLLRAKEQFLVAAESMPAEQRAQVVQAIDLARQTVETQREELISELSMLRVLASTGTMLIVFEHQLLGTLNGLRSSHRALTARLQGLQASDRRRLAAELRRLDGWIETAQHQGALLGLLIARKSRTRRKRLPVRPVVEAMKLAFASYTKDYDIKLENEVPPALKTPPMFEAELSAILVNLLTNAFKAVREQPRRRVAVLGIQGRGATVIRVCDTGVGATHERWAEFFQPFVGESEPDPILGEGTGLGLKIVSDFVGIYGGTARFITPERQWATCVEVSLPEG